MKWILPVIVCLAMAFWAHGDDRKPAERASELPKDLVHMIKKTFCEPEVRVKVTESLEKIGQTNVGKNQLRRAIVFLAAGDYERFLELRRSFMGDPRDLLMAANRKLVNRDYWFTTPFDQMGPVRK